MIQINKILSKIVFKEKVEWDKKEVKVIHLLSLLLFVRMVLVGSLRLRTTLVILLTLIQAEAAHLG